MKQVIKKIIVTTFILAMLFSFSGEVFADEVDDQIKRIEEIADQLGIDSEVLLEEMDVETNNNSNTSNTSSDTQTEYKEVYLAGIPEDFAFSKNLRKEDEGKDVKYLQSLLNTNPETMLTEYGFGSPGRETEYYGDLTEKAVRKFQNRYSDEILDPQGLSNPTGKVGYHTRVKLNELLGKTTATEPTNGSEDETSTDPGSVLTQLEQLASKLEKINERLNELEEEKTTPGHDYTGEEGELFVDSRADIRSEEVSRSQTREVAKYRLEAENSPIHLHRIDIYVEEAMNDSMTDFRRDIEKMALKINGKTVASQDIDRDNVDRYDEYIRFSGLDVEIDEGDYEDVVIVVTAEDNDSFNQTSYNIGPVESESIRGRDGAGIAVYGNANRYRTFYLDSLSNVTLDIEDNDSPGEGLVEVDRDSMTEVELLNFDLIAEEDDVDLETLIVELEGDDSNAGITFDSDARLDDIFQDALLYHGDDLIDIATVNDSNEDGMAQVQFEINEELESDDLENFRVVADVFPMDPDNSAEADRLGTKIRASVRESDNTEIAYGYYADEYIDLDDSLTGDWQELYYMFPEISLYDSDIETNSDGTLADGFLSFDLEPFGGELTITDINVKNEDTYDDGTYQANGWDVVVEINGEEVYTTADGSITSYILEEDELAEIEVFGVNEKSGWVRLAIDSITWENEEGDSFTWGTEYESIEDLQTKRTYVQ